MLCVVLQLRLQDIQTHQEEKAVPGPREPTNLLKIPSGHPRPSRFQFAVLLF